MSIFIFLIVLLVLVLVHEFGHFFSAKKFGIRVDEFGFGFPPKLFGKKFGETEYTFNLLPIGGFVKIFGENPDEENTNGLDKERSFVNKPKWQQAIVLLGGIFANFLLAWLLFSIGFMSGLPTSLGSEPKGYEIKNANLVLVSVLENSPAYSAGLKTGDKIVSIKSGEDVLLDINPETMKNFIVSHGKEEIEFGYIRGENEITKIAFTPKENEETGIPSIGVSMDQIGVLKLPFLRALWEGLVLDWNVTKGTVLGLFELIKDGIKGEGSLSSVTGPVGMVNIVGSAYEFGFVYLLSFAGLISVNLAVINLVPFPALDGGRLLFLIIEKIKGSKLNSKIINNINMIGFILLILLMLFVTYNDIIKL